MLPFYLRKRNHEGGNSRLECAQLIFPSALKSVLNKCWIMYTWEVRLRMRTLLLICSACSCVPSPWYHWEVGVSTGPVPFPGHTEYCGSGESPALCPCSPRLCAIAQLGEGYSRRSRCWSDGKARAALVSCQFALYKQLFSRSKKPLLIHPAHQSVSISLALTTSYF